ncbi:MAG: helix-turn-helix transcriptional regulator [Nitrospira sp.]|nr:helix-turn-helix transcriptional regulator [Nitrospira sp.]
MKGVKSVKDIQTRLGRRVRALRKARGWSQEELGERASLHPTYVGGIERGERNVSLINLAKLSEAFQIGMAEFLSFPAEQPEQKEGAEQQEGEKSLRELIAGDDQLAVAFFSTFCRKCESLKRFQELRALLSPDDFTTPSL